MKMFVVLFFKVLFSFINCVICFNLDTKFPLVYVDPSVDSYNNESTYFGYSIIMYSGDTSVFPWVMIGAPKGNDPKIGFRNPGVVYLCPIKEKCSLVETGFENDPHNSRKKFRLDDSWIGGSMDINYQSNRKMVCGHKWTSYSWVYQDYLTFGACVWSYINGSSYEIVDPLYTTDQRLIVYQRSSYYYGQGTAGFSVELTDDNKSVLGAPGFYSWAGTNILLSDSDEYRPVAKRYRQPRSYDEFTSVNIPSPIITSQIDAFDLTGYAVTSGNLYGRKRVFVTSGPRGEKLFGQVLIFSFNKYTDEAFDVHESKRGTQLGEYFGASLTVGDINRDGLDDLIVGSPYYASSKYNEGRIYVYLGAYGGPLQVPNEGSIIDGFVTNGLFGLNVRFVGDLNHDGFGDVAVAAPNELDGTGVVYLFKGSPTGLTVKPMQKIIGRNILPNIRGFGVGISKPCDFDYNNYLDIAIGAYNSGHVVILRGRVIAEVHHDISTSTKRLDFKTKSFMITVCLYISSQVSMGSVNMKVRRILTADEDLGRVSLRPEDQMKELLMSQNRLYCENITATMSVKSKIYDQPVKMSLSHEFVEDNIKGSPTIIGNEIIDNDNFCIRCPVYDKYKSSKKKFLFIPFSLGCGDDNVCNAKIELEPTLENLGNDNTFILGSQDSVRLVTKVRNTGERAYSTQLMITLPELVTFRQYPPNCGQETVSSALCSVDNPLLENSERTISVELDMKNVNTGRLGDSLVISLAVSTSSINQNENSKNITVKLVRQADITISGKSREQSYSYGNLTHGMPNFTQIFEVEKIGHSPLEEVTIKISVPHRMKNEKNDFLRLYKPEGYLGGQRLTCHSSFNYIFESTIKDYAAVDANASSYDFYIQPNSKITKRSVSNDEVEVFNNSALEYERSSLDTGDYWLTVNRTLYINCSRADVICSDVVCRSGPYKRDQSNAVLQIKMQLNVAPLKGLLEGKDIIVLSTHGSVLIKNPPNFVQSGDRPDQVVVSSLFIGSTKEVIQTWIIIVAVIVGLLVLLLITLGLIKAGFFERKKKAELQNMVSEVQGKQQAMDEDLINSKE